MCHIYLTNNEVLWSFLRAPIQCQILSFGDLLIGSLYLSNSEMETLFERGFLDLKDSPDDF